LTFANRDHESMTQAFSTLQRQHDTLVSQQDHWDELHRATQQMETLSSRLNHADNEEMKELRRIRDRHQLLETEYTALQRKAREQDTKIVNNERALLTARQSLTAANQRSAEWERRAKESEGKYDMTQTNTCAVGSRPYISRIAARGKGGRGTSTEGEFNIPCLSCCSQFGRTERAGCANKSQLLKPV
jgi:hypothetical protein